MPLTDEPTSRRRRLILASLISLILVPVISLGVYGLAHGPSTPDDSDPSVGPASHQPLVPSTRGGTASAPAEPLTWRDLPALPRTNDPIRYAEAVAVAMFTWDTMSGLSPDAYGRPVLVDADPSGAELNGLVSDLDGYLPTEEVWQQLREYETTQSLTIDRAYVPAIWARIEADAGEHIREGTVAVTIEGSLHREGIWYRESSEVEHSVAFTVFIACRPGFDRCHTLRLSELDNPLQ